MTETEKLILEVESKGTDHVNRELDKLDGKTKSATDGFRKLKLAALALGGGLIFVGKLLTDATRTYQDLNAQLKIAAKSSEGAAEAYQAIVDFASSTPYSVQQATEAFIKLTNLGLTPSERA